MVGRACVCVRSAFVHNSRSVRSPRVATLRFERVDHLPTRDHRRVIVLQMLTRPVLVHLAEPPCALRANIHNYRHFHAPAYTQTYTHMYTHAHKRCPSFVCLRLSRTDKQNIPARPSRRPPARPACGPTRPSAARPARPGPGRPGGIGVKPGRT